MKIMKTRIKTLPAICALGILGLMNINAIADNKKAINSEVVAGNGEMLTIESNMTEADFLNSAEALTALDADIQMEKYATKQILLNKNERTKTDFITSAESFTAAGTDEEIGKYALKLVLKQQSGNGNE
jgi:hypothetical protein